jgi:hypothetical protein
MIGRQKLNSAELNRAHITRRRTYLAAQQQ